MPDNCEAEIQVVTYNPNWPLQFEKERAILSEALKPYIIGGIEHVGSTAISGLVAKPVIDIMVGVEKLETSKGAIPILEQLGYCYFPYRPHQMHWFCKPNPQFRTHHLYLVPYESQVWLERIGFRDYLRRHSKATIEYAELKKKLARLYRFDREGYTEAKVHFVRRIIEQALPNDS